ncbi:CBF/NF-Y family transcription factor [Aspergillus nomiae NRRL 13137]|uniref:DNA polymerase epsilon subunit D n=1 Tax=Aspergillus nomiae NRRL (strain ATCC 15546 / NRRL 13137 / CBS 260.88 / M93) TaxID=1509407 RepID=A0A0L1J280_ASPN3|nr:CBF/NF-Y family transcription factor [Aspergillus nomiae NRRL 13137]KNG85921.1 CBF/NF-Y family transcription factor [Aspergillus nomiae NRRL 13137]
MPPRKSTGETVEDAAASSPQAQTQSPSTQTQPIQATEQQLKARAEGGVSIEDYLLPRSLTLRLAKSVLPPNTSIQKDAVLAIQKAATVFVSYLSSQYYSPPPPFYFPPLSFLFVSDNEGIVCANEATLKRTVAPSDVFSAISELEFDGFRSRLEKELDAFTELKAGKRKAKKGDAEATATEGAKGSAASEGGGASRGAKRVKRAEGEEAASSRPEEGDDGDETQDEAEQVDEHEHEHEHEHESEAEEEDEGEEEEEEEEELGEEEDIDRVEDLDRDPRAKRVMDRMLLGMSRTVMTMLGRRHSCGGIWGWVDSVWFYC